MSLKQLLGELVTSIAAGVAERVAASLKRDSELVGNHAQAHQIGYQLANELLRKTELATSPMPECLQPLADAEQHGNKMAVWNYQAAWTPEMQQALERLDGPKH